VGDPKLYIASSRFVASALEPWLTRERYRESERPVGEKNDARALRRDWKKQFMKYNVRDAGL
jgi:hypothetical protein